MNRKVVRIRENALVARLGARVLGTENVALVVGGTIYLHNVTRTDFLRSDAWVCHELRHVAQYERHGIVGFLLSYAIESLRRGYRANRFEVEARASEGDRSLLEKYRFE